MALNVPPLSKTSYPKHKIKVLLLEGIHPNATHIFEHEGFQVETMKGALSESELVTRIEGVHLLGIRSKTQITAPVIAAAKSLLGIGCFCIGTNQVDLRSANQAGIPVFNAPFSNTRSVAEMVIAEVICLARQIPDRSREVHQGVWKKVATHCHEVRGKTIGIVGYGHIGGQVSVLAESLGMHVISYDVAAKLSMGNTRPALSLKEVLAQSDFVTLHVPETPLTRNMMGAEEIAAMKRGAYLINASRGNVVDIPALAEALRSGHLGGAAVDVFPEEPAGNDAGFSSELQGLPNVILTPHIGGSTEEAQANIGKEVGLALTRFMNEGVTAGAVNFPRVESAAVPGAHRILNVHRNVPGVLRDINKIVSDLHANIRGQVLATDSEIGYLVMDLDQDVSVEVKGAIERLPTSIRTRILF
jgi:D-3-phosphoglycerate dehydrogenase